MIRLVAQVSYDEAGNPLTASITRYRNGDWDGCIVQAAEPFDTAAELIRKLWDAWSWAYGTQDRLPFDLLLP